MKAVVLDFRTAEVIFIEKAGISEKQMEDYITKHYHSEIEYMINQKKVVKKVLK